jgi:DNA ligase-1
MLAQAIDEATDFARYQPADYAAEWKWDGIRVQAVNEQGSAGSTAAPARMSPLPFRCDRGAEFRRCDRWRVVIFRNGHAAPFGDLQQRLNRKTAMPSCRRNSPPHPRL